MPLFGKSMRRSARCLIEQKQRKSYKLCKITYNSRKTRRGNMHSIESSFDFGREPRLVLQWEDEIAEEAIKKIDIGGGTEFIPTRIHIHNDRAAVVVILASWTTKEHITVRLGPISRFKAAHDAFIVAQEQCLQDFESGIETAFSGIVRIRPIDETLWRSPA